MCLCLWRQEPVQPGWRPIDPDMKRRRFLFSGIAGGLVAAGKAMAGGQSLKRTPSEIEGPFYPVIAQKDQDFDLTQVEGKDGVAKGRPIEIVGVVVDEAGQPIEDATVDLWQANAAGRYRHPHERNQAPLDEYFQGWAIVQSGTQGGFRFRTIFPGTYPASKGWTRPPHIHFKVTRKGYVELITQMYFPGHPLNERDRLLQRKTAEEQKQMISEQISEDPEIYRYQIVLAKA